MNTSIELSILFMLFWREEIMLFWQKEIKKKEKILMICFMIYLNYLNDKEKLLKLSIYKKYNFFKLENLDTHMF